MKLKIWFSDWPFFLSLFLLMFAGLLNQLSAGGWELFLRQTLWMVGGTLLFIFFWRFDYRKLASFQKIVALYVVYILLLSVLAFMHKRWLHFGSLGFQPSEFAKPLLVVLLASLFSENQEGHLPASLLGTSFLLVLIPVFLIAVADLDQAFLLLIMAATIILFAGLSKRTLAMLIVLVVIGSVVIGPLVWNLLKPYQKARVEAFLKPGKAQKRWSYQTRQALIATGSGGLTGLGFKQGLSSRLHYLPAKHTDLAFAVWAEEWGFVGSAVIISLFALLLACILRVAYLAKDLLGRFLAFGCASAIFWEVFFNIGGVIHLLPAASLPLPFLSYGGSAIFSNMIMLGLTASVMRRRFSFL